MASICFNMSPGLHKFLERYQSDHEKDIRDKCGEWDRHAMLRYIILKYGPILDLHIFKETMGDEVEISSQELSVPVYKEMTTEEKGLLFIKLAIDLGIDLKTKREWRMPRPGEKPVYIISCQGKKLYTIGREKDNLEIFEHEIKASNVHQLEENMPRLVGCNISQNKPVVDAEIIEIPSKDIQNKHPIEKTPSKDIQNKHPIEKTPSKDIQNKHPIEKTPSKPMIRVQKTGTQKDDTMTQQKDQNTSKLECFNCRKIIQKGSPNCPFCGQMFNWS